MQSWHFFHKRINSHKGTINLLKMQLYNNFSQRIEWRAHFNTLKQVYFKVWDPIKAEALLNKRMADFY